MIGFGVRTPIIIKSALGIRYVEGSVGAVREPPFSCEWVSCPPLLMTSYIRD